jgi:hypothetical protein
MPSKTFFDTDALPVGALRRSSPLDSLLLGFIATAKPVTLAGDLHDFVSVR